MSFNAQHVPRHRPAVGPSVPGDRAAGARPAVDVACRFVDYVTRRFSLIFWPPPEAGCAPPRPTAVERPHTTEGSRRRHTLVRSITALRHCGARRDRVAARDPMLRGAGPRARPNRHDGRGAAWRPPASQRHRAQRRRRLSPPEIRRATLARCARRSPRQPPGSSPSPPHAATQDPCHRRAIAAHPAIQRPAASWPAAVSAHSPTPVGRRGRSMAADSLLETRTDDHGHSTDSRGGALVHAPR